MRGRSAFCFCSWLCSLSSTPPTHGFRHVSGGHLSSQHPLSRDARAQVGRGHKFPQFPLRCLGGSGEGDHECSTEFGNMRYRAMGLSQPPHASGITSGHKVLFLHGLGSSSETCQPPESLLSSNSFVIPDFFAHGRSPAPVDQQAYRMQSLAACVAEILSKERASDVFVIAHSMGGPIGVELCELAISSGRFRINGLVYEEGNLDEGDCFGSKKLAEKGAPSVTSSSSEEDRRRFGKCECAKDLVDVSVQNTLLPRILKLKEAGVPVWFAYGEKNKGRFTSEQLLADHGQRIEFIANGGHSMHADEGAPLFWSFVEKCIQSR